MKADFRYVETNYFLVADVECDPNDPTRPANMHDVLDNLHGEPDDKDTHVEIVPVTPATIAPAIAPTPTTAEKLAAIRLSLAQCCTGAILSCDYRSIEVRQETSIHEPAHGGDEKVGAQRHGAAMKILVIGGTGNVGAEVVKELQKRKADIRLLIRKDSTPMPPGVEVAIGDLLDPVSVEKAMHGVDKLYLLNAVAPDELTQGLIAYDLAKKLKLKHIVYHSVFRVEHFKDVPHFASKLAIESALREFEVPFTIIRPNYFIQNDATLKDALMKAGIYPAPLGNIGISVVDIRDIAEATAIVLTSDEHDGKTYNLNGPEALSGPKAASIWSKLLGKEIRYAGHDMDDFEEQMRKSAPSWSAFDIRMMFQGYLERGFVAETGDVEKLTKLLGHALRRYEDFAAETAALWK